MFYFLCYDYFDTILHSINIYATLDKMDKSDSIIRNEAHIDSQGYNLLCY